MARINPTGLPGLHNSGARQLTQIRLVRPLPVAVDLARVEGQACRDPFARGQFEEILRQRVEPGMTIHLRTLQLEGGEPGRSVNHMMRVVAIPIEGGNPPLSREAPIKLRSRQRCQDQQLHARQLHLSGEADSRLDRIPVVALEAEYEHAMNVDAGVLYHANGIANVLQRLALFHLREALGTYGFEADEHRMTSRPFHQPHQLRISRQVSPHLR